MKKTTALELLGPDPASVARHLGVTKQAIAKWPDPLPQRIADRVIAARLRLEWLQAVNSKRVHQPLPELIADAFFGSDS